MGRHGGSRGIPRPASLIAGLFPPVIPMCNSLISIPRSGEGRKCWERKELREKGLGALNILRTDLTDHVSSLPL